MLLEEIGRDGTAPRLVVLAHEGPDIVAHLHTAGLERLTHRIGLHIAVIACQRLVHLKLHGLAWMSAKAFIVSSVIVLARAAARMSGWMRP